MANKLQQLDVPAAVHSIGCSGEAKDRNNPIVGRTEGANYEAVIQKTAKQIGVEIGSRTVKC